VVIRGTLDQIRREGGRLVVCDLKTGKGTGLSMIHDYAYQQAAYVLAARASGFPEAEPGYIIRCYGYRERSAKLPSPDGVYWWLPFDVAGCRAAPRPRAAAGGARAPRRDRLRAGAALHLLPAARAR
jgi:hypothetical protein